MKRWIIFGITFLFFVGSLVYVNVAIFNTDNPDTGVYTQRDEITATLKDPMADSDGDGLKNWEEDLYGSSKKNVDSDGDGVNDGDEIARGTDPTVYGNVSRNINVISENTQGYEFAQTSNPNSIEELASMVGSVEPAETMPEIEFSPDQLTMKQCLNQIATVLQNSLVTSINDAATINSYLTGESTNTYPIEQMKQAAGTAWKDMQSVVQPVVCNNLQPVIAAFAGVYQDQNQALDLVLATTASTTEHYEAWAVYARTTEQWTNTVMGMREIAVRENVTFVETEPGYMFTQGY